MLFPVIARSNTLVQILLIVLPAINVRVGVVPFNPCNVILARLYTPAVVTGDPRLASITIVQGPFVAFAAFTAPAKVLYITGPVFELPG